MGTGLKLCSKSSYLRDLSPLLEACSKYGTKVLISSAGGDGTDAHVDELLDIIKEIATDKGYNFKVFYQFFVVKFRWLRSMRRFLPRR